MTPDEIAALGLKHFSPATDKNISWDVVDPVALKALDKTRDDCGQPLIVTSNYRTPDNPAGFPTDSHREIPCKAFDISMKRTDGSWNSQLAYRLIEAAQNNGFARIGINTTNKHIHLDSSSNFPQFVLFNE
jgi:hypothetical protein